MTAAERKRRRRVVATALMFYALGNRHGSVLKRAVRAGALGILANGGGAEHVAMAIYLVARSTVGKVRTASRAAAQKAWKTHTGLPVSPIETATGDLGDAERAATGLHRTFGQRLDRAREEARNEREAIRDALDDLDPSFDRIGIDETMEAVNDETIELNSQAAALGWTIVETWEAILDGRTCTECAALDGQTVERPERFADPPPLHNRCRCFISSDIVAVAATG